MNLSIGSLLYIPDFLPLSPILPIFARHELATIAVYLLRGYSPFKCAQDAFEICQIVLAVDNDVHSCIS